MDSDVDHHPLLDEDRHVVPLRGEIQVILGPMFSGKSTELLRRMRRYKIARHDCLVVKYAKDVRYDEENLATHDKQVFPAVAADKLAEIRATAERYSVIGIDEGQFFPDIVEFSEEMANLRKTVIIAALDGTYLRKPFGRILELIPLAEKVEKLTAVCMICHVREASFTKRRGVETEIELIGGEDKYLAVCRSCHNKESCSPLKTPKRVPFTPFKSAKRTRSQSCDGGSEVVNGANPCMNLSFDQGKNGEREVKKSKVEGDDGSS